jgi:hypothetical protein
MAFEKRHTTGSSRSSWLVALGWGVAAGVAAALWLDTASEHAPEDERPLANTTASKRGTVLAEGVHYRAFDSEGTTVELAVDRVVKQRRRLGPLSLRGVDELVLKRVRLTLSPGSEGGRQPEEVLESLDLAAIAPSILDFADSLGFDDITRVVVERLTIDVQSGPGSGWLVLAERARIGSDSTDLTLRGGVSISTDLGLRLDARKVRLIHGSSAFEVVGSYRVLQDEHLIQSGADATFVVDPRGYLIRLQD